MILTQNPGYFFSEILMIKNLIVDILMHLVLAL